MALACISSIACSFIGHKNHPAQGSITIGPTTGTSINVGTVLKVIPSVIFPNDPDGPLQDTSGAPIYTDTWHSNDGTKLLTSTIHGNSISSYTVDFTCANKSIYCVRSFTDNFGGSESISSNNVHVDNSPVKGTVTISNLTTPISSVCSPGNTLIANATTAYNPNATPPTGVSDPDASSTGVIAPSNYTWYYTDGITNTAILNSNFIQFSFGNFYLKKQIYVDVTYPDAYSTTNIVTSNRILVDLNWPTLVVVSLNTNPTIPTANNLVFNITGYTPGTYFIYSSGNNGTTWSTSIATITANVNNFNCNVRLYCGANNLLLKIGDGSGNYSSVITYPYNHAPFSTGSKFGISVPTGGAFVGTTLTASGLGGVTTGTSNADGGTVIYSWYIDGVKSNVTTYQLKIPDNANHGGQSIYCTAAWTDSYGCNQSWGDSTNAITVLMQTLVTSVTNKTMWLLVNLNQNILSTEALYFKAIKTTGTFPTRWNLVGNSPVNQFELDATVTGFKFQFAVFTVGSVAPSSSITDSQAGSTYPHTTIFSYP